MNGVKTSLMIKVHSCVNSTKFILKKVRVIKSYQAKLSMVFQDQLYSGIK